MPYDLKLSGGPNRSATRPQQGESLPRPRSDRDRPPRKRPSKTRPHGHPRKAGSCPRGCHGSSVTTAVPPTANLPARPSATTSAASRGLRSADADSFAVAVQDYRAHRRVRIGVALDQLALLDGQPHGGLTLQTRRCRDASAAWRRNACTAAAGSSAL